jgi:hypothetical protein
MDLNSDSKMAQLFAHSNQTGGHCHLKADAGYRIAASRIKMASTRPWGIRATGLRRSRRGEKLGALRRPATSRQKSSIRFSSPGIEHALGANDASPHVGRI